MKREKYPSAPLRFVALELQFDLVPDLSSADGRAAIYDEIRDDFPVAEAGTSIEVTLSGPLPGPPQTAPELRMLNMDRTRSVTVSATSLTVQTSQFVDFPEFSRSVELALHALEKMRIATAKRLGLRYVDEVRVPGVTRAQDWALFIDPKLLGGVEFAADYKIDGHQEVLALTTPTDPDRHLMMRYGAGDGFSVDPNGPLSLPGGARQGHYFLLDLDSYWLPSDGKPRPFEIGRVLETSALLSETAHDLFEAAITDKLRNDVMRRPEDGE